jgi:hypothetical protein
METPLANRIGFLRGFHSTNSGSSETGFGNSARSGPELVESAQQIMGLPKFETQESLIESLGSIAPQLFDHQDKYNLFA